MTKHLAPKILLILISSMTLISCAPSGIIPQSRMDTRLQYRGFSVGRPQSSDWFAIANEQNPTQAIFRKRSDSETHTFVMSIKLRTLPRIPTTPMEFEEIAKDFHVFQNTTRFELKNLKQTTGTRQGQWCVYFEEQIVDKKAPNAGGRELVGRGIGFVCLHPSFSNTVVFADCTERGFENELNEQLLEEGKALLLNIQLESAPGIPVE